MRNTLKKLDCIFERRDFKRLLLLLIPMTFVALLNVVGIFSILPFMQLVASPEVLDEDQRMRWLASAFGVSSRRSMLISMGLVVLAIYGITAIANVLNGWLMHRVGWGIAHRLSMRMLNQYARMPYEYFLVHNSAEMVKKVVADIQSLTSGILMVTCKLAASLIKSVAILVFLLFVNFKLAIFAFILFGGVYLFIHAIRHRFIEQLGVVRLATISERLKSFTDTMIGIKTIRVNGSTSWFVERFEKASKTFCHIQPKYHLFTQIPKHLVEFLAFGGIIAVILYQLFAGNELARLVPELSLFAMATYKLLPSLSDAFTQAASLSHNLPVIEEAYEDMKQVEGLLLPIAEFETAIPMKFDDEITLHSVSYQYESSGVPVLNEISLEIKKGQKCAFVGSTGCGKSTLVDVMVGLLPPTGGELKVDSESITNENTYNWQKCIAYVPQDVFLFDDTIAANIALGIKKELIDEAKLKRATRLAQVDEFIDTEFRDGLNTIVGEKGVRLSGGQRQRIGLARVFYREPKVLFLDEATSALDSITEEAIVSAIDKELPEVTVVMVAHRLSSTRFCDKIVFMDEGKIVDSGSFEELVQSNNKFRQMVEVAE